MNKKKTLAFMFCGANFSLQLSTRTQFAKIRSSNKKVIAENKCKNIKTRFFFSFSIRLALQLIAQFRIFPSSESRHCFVANYRLSRVGISGTTAKSRQRKFVPSSHPGPFAVVATSRKSQTKVGTLVCFDFFVKE